MTLSALWSHHGEWTIPCHTGRRVMRIAAGQRAAPDRPATVGEDTFPVTSRRRCLVPPARTVADAADAFLARATAPRVPTHRR